MIKMIKNRKILVVPAIERGRGGGHLTRCVRLVNELRVLGRQAFLYIKPENLSAQVKNLFYSMNLSSERIISPLKTAPDESLFNFDYIILDYFQTARDEIIYWKKIAPVIGIDEGGSYRDSFDFLIDILIPENFASPSANITSAALMVNKPNAAGQREMSPAKDRLSHFNYIDKSLTGGRGSLKQKILITFGQEDPASLGVKAARFLSAVKTKYNIDITLIKGALSTDKEELKIADVKIIDAVPNLASILCEYDLVITHYGITAYEALFAGTPVLLDHPTPYHKKLAKAAGFSDVKRLYSFARSKEPVNQEPFFPSRAFAAKPFPAEFVNSRFKNNQSLAELISGFYPIIYRRCPVCGDNAPEKSAARFEDRVYRRCKMCGIIFMDRITELNIKYGKEYFFESYIKQYGKTYLEDFENIKCHGIKRIKTIISLLSKYNVSHVNTLESRSPVGEKTSDFINGLPLLDIGCAYGPFLSAAKEEGFSPFGIDPAQDAVRYVNERLGIPVIKGFFPGHQLHAPGEVSGFPNSYSVITLWFVIEHFSECIIVLNEIKKFLKPEGILAFSTPSYSGVSGRANQRKFLSESAADHFTIWSPKTCKKALAVSGFKVKKIIITGHHPERFPFFVKLSNNKKGFMYKLLFAVSQLFKLGDTFEVYAERL